MQSGEERVCQRPKNRALAQPDGAGTCPCCAGENPVCDARALAESCCSEPPRLSGASGQRRGGNLSRQAARLSRHILSRCAPCGIPRPRNPACHASLQPHRNPARSPSGRAFRPKARRLRIAGSFSTQTGGVDMATQTITVTNTTTPTRGRCPRTPGGLSKQQAATAKFG